MADITHSDYCPVGNTGDEEDCEHCTAEMGRVTAYYRALYDAEPHYTEAEIMDAYSEPCERHKREGLLRRIQ